MGVGVSEQGISFMHIFCNTRGKSAAVTVQACCMVFKIGRKHNDISTPNTFFGYYKDDGFKKKKNIGRIEQIDPLTQQSKWIKIEKEWIDLYRNRREQAGRSATHRPASCSDRVTANIRTPSFSYSV